MRGISRHAAETEAVKRLVAKVRQAQPNSLPNRALPFDSPCGVIAFKISQYFTIAAPITGGKHLPPNIVLARSFIHRTERRFDNG